MHFSQLFQHCPVCGSANFKPNNEKSKRCESCYFVYYINASAAVAVFIENDEKQLLICVRGKEPAKGTYDLPGGFVDANESAEQAVIREINEELGANVAQSDYLFSLPNEYEYSGMTIPTLDMFYKCVLKDNRNLKPADDVAECFFLNKDEIDPGKFGLNSIRKAVALFLENSPNK
jgi:NADH pyrophosphatase NudC (nudix superfamily)